MPALILILVDAAALLTLAVRDHVHFGGRVPANHHFGAYLAGCVHALLVAAYVLATA